MEANRCPTNCQNACKLPSFDVVQFTSQVNRCCYNRLAICRTSAVTNIHKLKKSSCGMFYCKHGTKERNGIFINQLRTSRYTICKKTRKEESFLCFWHFITSLKSTQTENLRSSTFFLTKEYFDDDSSPESHIALIQNQILSFISLGVRLPIICTGV